MPAIMKLSEAIKEARKAKRHSIRAMAKESGISKSYITQIQQGEQFNPTLNVIEKLAKYLDVGINEIIEMLKENGITEKSD
ncbi:MAG TPA: helix-turn-helix transcriptional regulator [Clostridiales bacterium]|nr:helix-turn-helix transcriptional regulator [Clostridiales bacterium]